MSDFNPVVGCFVTLAQEPGQRFRVQRVVEMDEKTHVELMGRNGLVRTTPDQLGSGFVPGDVVQNVPFSRVKKSLGEGRVISTRELGSRQQVLVEFFGSGERHWLPFQYLKCIKSPEGRLVDGEFTAGLAERFRLKNLAYALEHWNENTGALSQLEVDPLPHQIHLVHHILASGNLNWLIADDVGLGKTIEVGMLLAALRQRNMKRILVVCPAGLTRQWQEELAEKFGMDDFRIYGRDFNIKTVGHWPLYPRVIASMDQLKHENHLPVIRQSGDWDVVVFDEAHRLSRRQWGRRLEFTERYRLAEELRSLTDHMLLLTATPHQGDHDRFVALLELLRPEWREELHSLRSHPEILQECIYRNRKADVTDATGDFIFHGQTTNAIRVPIGDEEKTFDTDLQDYVRQGYRAADAAGQRGFAIGFVMTTFRKLAASSPAAILSSLRNRLAALEETQQGESDEFDERFSGEFEESAVEKSERTPFFEGEKVHLQRLIGKATALVDRDRKLDAFMNRLLPQILERNSDEKVLVFTEYRATQSCLVHALTERFGPDSVVVINGGLGVDGKRAAVQEFDGSAQFLVSTEAGGEGLNLHRNCHIMVNYDLPWNPMRLVQRVGRLYRYGQKEHVMVFNLHAPATLDARVVEGLYDRIDSVVEDMAQVGDEFNSGLRDEIFGELASLLDVRSILESGSPEERTQARIDEALAKARDAHELHSRLLTSAHGYKADEMRDTLTLTKDHLRSFVISMLKHLGCEIRESVRDGQIVDVFLNEEIAEFLGRTRLCRVTFAREYQHFQNVEMMDFQNPLFELLVEKAKAHEFAGSHACIELDSGSALVSAILRWQDGQGTKMREEYVTVTVDGRGAVLNAPEVVQWLATEQADAQGEGSSRDSRREVLNSAHDALDRRLAEASNIYLHPADKWLLSAAWAHS